MYAIYEKQVEGEEEKYNFKSKTCLFGCNSGKIASLLREELTSENNEPYKWHIDMLKQMPRGKTLIINLKPNNIETNMSIYEIVNVWGYSEHDWTPIMLHLRGLIVDETSQKFNEERFSVKTSNIDDPIFSMLYLNGTVKNGEIVGKWTAPRPSPTNSCLLWPETFQYFIEARKSILSAG